MAQKAGATAAEEEKKKIVGNKIFVKNTAITEIARGKSFKLKFDIVKGKDIDGKKNNWISGGTWKNGREILYLSPQV